MQPRNRGLLQLRLNRLLQYRKYRKYSDSCSFWLKRLLQQRKLRAAAALAQQVVAVQGLEMAAGQEEQDAVAQGLGTARAQSMGQRTGGLALLGIRSGSQLGCRLGTRS